MGHTDLASSSANENRLRVHNCRGYLLIFIEMVIRLTLRQAMMTGKALGDGTVRGENCILSFVFTLLSIRVSWVLCCFLILFGFHLGEAGAVCNGLEKENGWLVVTSVIVDDARRVFRGVTSTAPFLFFLFSS